MQNTPSFQLLKQQLRQHVSQDLVCRHPMLPVLPPVLLKQQLLLLLQILAFLRLFEDANEMSLTYTCEIISHPLIKV